MGWGSAEDPCRRDTCHETSSDPTSKRDTLTAPHRWFKMEHIYDNLSFRGKLTRPHTLGQAGRNPLTITVQKKDDAVLFIY